MQIHTQSIENIRQNIQSIKSRITSICYLLFLFPLNPEMNSEWMESCERGGTLSGDSVGVSDSETIQW